MPDRAIFLPDLSRLVIADLHLGKGGAFRTSGLAIPTGGTRDDLSRLARLVVQTGCRELLVLGDFLHGRPQPGADSAWNTFRTAIPDVAIRVVAGNHDRALRAHDYGIDLVADPWLDGTLAYAHIGAPEPPAGAGFTLSGHLHPVAKLPGLSRVPLFWLQPHALVLPAFSGFTGGYPVPTRSLTGWASDGRTLVPLGSPRHPANARNAVGGEHSAGDTII